MGWLSLKFRWFSALVAYRSADQNTRCSATTPPHKLGVTEPANRRFPDDGGADKVVAATPRTSHCQTGRFASAAAAACSWPHTPRSERGRLHPDPGSEPVEHCAHLQLNPRPRAPLRLRVRPPTLWRTHVYNPLYSSFAGDKGAWSTAKMHFTVPPNGVAKLRFGALSQKRCSSCHGTSGWARNKRATSGRARNKRERSHRA